MTFPDAVYAYAPADIPQEIVETALAKANARSNFRMVYENRVAPAF